MKRPTLLACSLTVALTGVVVPTPAMASGVPAPTTASFPIGGSCKQGNATVSNLGAVTFVRTYRMSGSRIVSSVTTSFTFGARLVVRGNPKALSPDMLVMVYRNGALWLTGHRSNKDFVLFGAALPTDGASYQLRTSVTKPDGGICDTGYSPILHTDGTSPV